MTNSFLGITTPNQFRDALRYLKLVNPPFQIEWKVHDDPGGGCSLHIMTTVRDRDSGLPVFITFVHPVPLGSYLPLSEWLHLAFTKVFLHELNECFHFNGQRLYDPHRDEKL